MKYCREMGLLREQQRPDCHCLLVDEECSSRSCQRATYCHSELLDSLPENGIIFQK